MSELTFKLEAFEGPLDLLLHLISKHKLNIYDIEISLLLEQYLEYIDSLDEQDFDAAGDFLAMAARLVYIKTCSLLPQAEEAEEMKKELQGELIEYSVCKEAAARLRRDCVYGDVFVRPPEKIPVNMTFTGSMPVQALVDAYMGMTAKARRMTPVRAEQFSPIVASRIVTVTSKIVYVLKKLYKGGECTVEELYHNVTDKSARVATFLAVLELAKSGRIYLNEDNTLICFNRETPRRHVKQEGFGEQPAAAQPETQPADESVSAEVMPVKTETDIPETESETDINETAEDAILQEVLAEPDAEIEAEYQPEEQEYYTEEDCEPEENDDIAGPEQRIPVHTARYALESLNRTHSLAVPVYIEVSDSWEEESAPAEPVEEPATVAETAPSESVQEPAAVTEQYITPAVEEAAVEPEPEISIIQPTEPAAGKPAAEPVCETLTYIKENRFSVRCRWGCPAQTSNCWSYWRERV